MPYKIRYEPEESHLVAFDFHFPFENRRMVNAFLDYLSERKFKSIILGGDINDFYPDSVFVKDPKITPQTYHSKVQPIIADFLTNVRVGAPEATIYWLEGNHEFRWVQNLWEKVDTFRGQLLGMGIPPDLVTKTTAELSAFSIPELFPSIAENRIKYVPGRGNGNVIINNKVVVIHGDKSTLSKHSGYGAKKKISDAGGWWVFGHGHRNGMHQHTIVGGTFLGQEVGCMCDLNPEYVQSPNWQHGFAVIHFMQGSKFRIEPLYQV